MLPSKEDFYQQICLEIAFYCEMLLPKDKTDFYISNKDCEFIGFELNPKSKYGITVLFDSYTMPLEVLVLDTLYDLYEILKNEYEINKSR